MSESLFFLFMGTVLLIGFVSNFMFKLTHIPPSLVCLLIGVLIGPVLGGVDSASFATAASYFGGLALIIIMFEGGLDFDIEDVMSSLSGAVLKGIIGCVITAGCMIPVLIFGADISLVYALILALVLSCNSPAIVLPVMNLIGAEKKEKTLLSLESTVGEIFMVVASILVLETIVVQEHVAHLGSMSMASTAGLIIYEVILSTILGFAFGMTWHRIMLKFGTLPLSHFLTLGVVMFVFGLTELLGGKGVLSALAFGLAFRNAGSLFSKFNVFRDRMRKRIPIPDAITRIDPDIHRLTADLSFLVRTFFFVYLGLILDLSNLNLKTFLIVCALTIIILLARWGNAWLSWKSGNREMNIHVSLAMVPRGLANAVIAIIAVRTLQKIGVEEPDLDAILPIVSGTIVLSNVLMAPLIFVSQRKKNALSGVQ